LRRNLPLSAVFTVQPGVVAYQGMMLTVKAARLSFDAEAGRVMAHLAGSVSKGDMALEDFSGDISADGLRWSFANGQAALEAPKAKLVFTARSAAIGIVAGRPSVNLALTDFSLSSAGGIWSGHADLAGNANADFQPEKVKALLATDRPLADAAAAN